MADPRLPADVRRDPFTEPKYDEDLIVTGRQIVPRGTGRVEFVFGRHSETWPEQILCPDCGHNAYSHTAEQFRKTKGRTTCQGASWVSDDLRSGDHWACVNVNGERPCLLSAARIAQIAVDQLLRDGKAAR